MGLTLMWSGRILYHICNWYGTTRLDKDFHLSSPSTRMSAISLSCSFFRLGCWRTHRPHHQRWVLGLLAAMDISFALCVHLFYCSFIWYNDRLNFHLIVSMVTTLASVLFSKWESKPLILELLSCILRESSCLILLFPWSVKISAV